MIAPHYVLLRDSAEGQRKRVPRSELHVCHNKYLKSQCNNAAQGKQLSPPTCPSLFLPLHVPACALRAART